MLQTARWVELLALLASVASIPSKLIPVQQYAVLHLATRLQARDLAVIRSHSD